MQKQVLIICVMLGLAAVADATARWHQLHDYTFERYVKEHRKVYSSSEEHAKRRDIFAARLSEIKAHNQDNTKTWKMGVNQFTDRTEEELNVVLGLKKGSLYQSKEKNSARVAKPVAPVDLTGLPPSIDWRDKKVVTDVKDQGQCGSCWSFGTAETVESHWALKTGQLMDLSQQQILDCTPNTDDCGGVGGCGGGTPEIAYEKIKQLGGLSSEWTYPYISYFGTNYACKFNDTQTRPLASLASYVVLPSNQYEPVIKALATVGPLAINVDASVWFTYETGVFNGCNQTNPDIDHVVQLVGYGTDTKFGDYWLVRNSWATGWGEDGYIRLKRDADKTECGVDLKPQDGTGCNNGPATVVVCGTCGILYDVSYPVIA